MSGDGWVLCSPRGSLFPSTFSVDRDEAWGKAFNLLCEYKWMRPYWKDWDGSIAAAERRGWRIVEACVTPASQE